MRLKSYLIYGFLIIWGREVYSEEYELDEQFSVRRSDTGFGWDLLLTSGGEKEVVASLGRTLNDGPQEITRNGGLFAQHGDVHLNISIEGDETGKHLLITWTAPKDTKLMDCKFLGWEHWYGGPQQKHQYWPIEKLKLKDYSYISKEADNAAIIEPYWLSSAGFFIYLDKKVPLFVDQHNILKNAVCFVAEVKPPYSEKRTRNILSYRMGYFHREPRDAHMYVVKKFLGKPSGVPDTRMVQHPIWSTWAEYKRPINESIVMDFAQKIVDFNFTNSQIEIDDLWEVCYGSLEVDKAKFPNMKEMNTKLKAMGFRVTIWIHPFINEGCDPWYSEGIQKGYLVKNEKGDVKTSWWNSDGPTAAYIDFMNPAATKWWTDKLDILKKEHAIDSFKFDAGESSWSPQVPVQTGDIEENPSHITQTYVRACAKYGPMVEVRAGQRTQDLPIFVRMIDKDSEWDFENGLPTLVTTLLQMNMNGYPLVLPDMIGGNGYNKPPSKEMFIRWLQANTFMPSLQYSYVPWDYDNETIELSRKFTDLHIQYSPQIIEALKKSVETGAPANPPIWWIDPHDRHALGVWDEYLLGENILVAPVLQEKAVTRDIYLPKGKWKVEGKPDKIIDGPVKLRNYPAGIDTLPFFVRV